jgi:hypothetical protein
MAATGGRNLLKWAGLLSAVVVLGATFGLPAAASSTQSHRSYLIDTHRVIGTPFAIATANGVHARPGGAVAPTITTQPVSGTVTSGSTATFTAAASGTPTPSVRWYDSTNGRSFRAISGATSATLSFTATTSESGYEFEAVFSNQAGSATTKAATLTVTTPPPTPPPSTAPIVTKQPAGQSVAAGSTVTFTAAASGSPTPTVQWYVVVSGGSPTLISGATSTSYSFVTTSSESGNEYEATFSNTISGTVHTATTNPATLTVTAAPPPPPPPPAPAQSTNWSGYADTSGTFSAVSSSWTVPTVTCAGTASAYSAQWIGIDGYSSSTVEQDGTEADCLNGSPSYDAWYEMYGDNAVNSGNEVELSPSEYPIKPGDIMTASVSVSGSTWTLAIADTTRGWSLPSTTITFTGAAKSSAEWIVERPELCGRTCSLTSLADFANVTFTSGLTSSTAGTNEPISSNTNSAIEMISSTSSKVLALPSALTSNGEGFSDTWEGSS